MLVGERAETGRRQGGGRAEAGRRETEENPEVKVAI